MKKKIKYYSISYGHLVACWHIVYLTNEHRGMTPKDAINIVEKSGKLGGTVPAKAGLKICLDYGFLTVHSSQLYITDITTTSLLPECNQEDINISALRKVLLHILSYHNFEWLIFYDSDPEIFRESLIANDPEWVNLLDNAFLFDFEKEEVNIWWDNILSKYEDYKEELKKAIGDVGEKITYRYELDRITNDGFTPARSFVKWASRISDRFGFDVLSIRGKYFLSTYSERDKIQIEVKSSDTTNLGRFRFYISKPEWNKALEDVESYFFFCWAGINLETESAEYGPFIIPATELVEHMPTDNSDMLQWSECRCVMDVSKYQMI
ncbi:DUF3883 domain-containing protein [Parapedobacter tibetensis]|uniref:DUF3883 domain-containing protein n=1 Tax=Parapedobacter tibetensis TaxID=2972951 RepID=UPI00214D4C9A|nr:DUF3883 domain-containing protein [Parapedobacter tibetensis]